MRSCDVVESVFSHDNFPRVAATHLHTGSLYGMGDARVVFRLCLCLWLSFPVFFLLLHRTHQPISPQPPPHRPSRRPQLPARSYQALHGRHLAIVSPTRTIANLNYRLRRLQPRGQPLFPQCYPLLHCPRISCHARCPKLSSSISQKPTTRISSNVSL